MAYDYDVIVIGAGGAGMAAALSAREQGANVLLLEAGERVGGSTRLSGGVYYAAGTSVQRARGIENDSPDAMFLYYMTLNQHKVEPSLVRRLCDEAPQGLEWLISLGVRFPAEYLYASGVEEIARGHLPEDLGEEIASVLEGHVNRKGIEVLVRTRASGLIIQDGNVRGVRVGDDLVTAPAVVITTGGMGNNREMLARHFPDALAHGEHSWYVGSQYCRGDGISLGESAGAGTTGHNRGVLIATPGFARDFEVSLPEWLVYINRDGRRFIKETTKYAVVAGVIRAQLNSECFAVFDENARLYGERQVGRFPLPSWTPDTLADMAKRGRIFKADTIEQLAEMAGIRSSTLATTVRQYNEACAKGVDEMFFKAKTGLRPLTQAPFYAVRMIPSMLLVTGFGLRINADAQVLDDADEPVAGLFSAGETTGGVIGERYIGSGNSIANSIVFGRIAGRNAAKRAAVEKGTAKS